MSLQETLTEDAPFVVDLTCSTKRQWPKVATVRFDVDPAIRHILNIIDEFIKSPPSTTQAEEEKT